MKNIFAMLFVIAIISSFGAPYAMSADPCETPPTVPGSENVTLTCSPTTAVGLLNIMNKVFTTIFVILVTAASFALLYAAFLYVTSEGEQEKVKNAKNIIIYAVVALIIAALAFGAPRAIQSFITG